MSLQPSLYNSQSRPVGHVEPSKPVGRLRSACDSCHKSKIRCSGGNPCLTCLISKGRCAYSLGNRLGRPKGSKNKRAVRNESKSKRDETREDKDGNNSGGCRGPDPEQRQGQHQQDPMPAEFDIEHGFHANLPEDIATDGNPNLLPNANLASFINSAGEAPNLEPCANTSFPHPPYNDLPFGTPESACDSGYATGTVSSAADDPVLLSPGSAISPHGQQGPWGTNSFTPSRLSHCPCLQQQIQLVYQLGELQCPSTGSINLDAVLQGVQLAQGPWKNLMDCECCQSQDDKREVFLLFATSIRILLYSFQELNVSSHRDDAPAEAATRWDLPDISDVGVSVGNFKLTGGIREEVIGVVVRNALQSITVALLHLWERTGKPRSEACDGLGNRSNSASSSALEFHVSIHDTCKECGGVATVTPSHFRGRPPCGRYRGPP
ncbi:hypothetical protein F5Y13DRAFT_174970 [Hypoxylon sp. FL1857]|nr:hypothetical protein F5Y13DRAFT_174970 [Hypoxylon sp. FL1857]